MKAEQLRCREKKKVEDSDLDKKKKKKEGRKIREIIDKKKISRGNNNGQQIRT